MLPLLSKVSVSDFEDHSDATTVSVCLTSYDGREEHYLSLLLSSPFILSLYHQAHSLHCFAGQLHSLS